MIHVLKNELSELYNKQMLIGLAVSFVLIIALGVLMTGVISSDMLGGGVVHIVDNDKTGFTQQVQAQLQEWGYTVDTADSPEAGFTEKDWADATVLPAGMTALLDAHQPCQIECVEVLRSTSAFSSAGNADVVQAAIRELLTKEYLQGDLAFLDAPAELIPYTYANGKTVQAERSAILSSVSLFDRLLPLALFLLVVLTAQTIITAIATEKTDKTLEALLTSPVSRSSIIAAKMLAALLVSLTYAAVYALGFVAAMLLTVSGQNTEDLEIGTALADMASVRQAVLELGIDIPVLGWVGVLAQLALTLGIALTASVILGGLTEDAKSAQTASMPILLCTMFPYMLSMVSDIRSMDGVGQWVLYAIPFTHTFVATEAMHFHDYGLFWGGLVYQAVFLGVLVLAALKLYNSDVLFTGGALRRKQEKV